MKAFNNDSELKGKLLREITNHADAGREDSYIAMRNKLIELLQNS